MEKSKYLLTLPILDGSKPGEVLHSGYVSDTYRGINMSGTGSVIRFVVKVGDIGDWCVYAGGMDDAVSDICFHGDKVQDRQNIANVIDFSGAVWERYRH